MRRSGCSAALRPAARRRGRRPAGLVPADRSGERRRRAPPRAGGSPAAVRRRRRSGGPPAGGRSRSSPRTSSSTSTTLDAPGRTRRSRSPSTTRTPGTPHNVEINDASGDEGLQGRDLHRRRRPRPTTSRRSPAGTYTFVCSVHPTDDGTVDAPVGGRRRGPTPPSPADPPRRSLVAVADDASAVLVVRRAHAAGDRRRRSIEGPAGAGDRRDDARRRAVRPGRPPRPAGRRQLLGPVLRPLPRRVPAARGEARGARRRRPRRRRRPDGRSARAGPRLRRRVRRDLADGRSTRTSAIKARLPRRRPAADLLHRPRRDPPLDPDRRADRRRLRAPVRADRGRRVSAAAAATPAPAIEVDGLVKRYGERTVVDGVSLEVARRRARRAARAERRGQDDDGRDPRGLPARRRRHGPGARRRSGDAAAAATGRGSG